MGAFRPPPGHPCEHHGCDGCAACRGWPHTDPCCSQPSTAVDPPSVISLGDLRAALADVKASGQVAPIRAAFASQVRSRISDPRPVPTAGPTTRRVWALAEAAGPDPVMHHTHQPQEEPS